MICSHQDESLLLYKFYLFAPPKILKHETASLYYFIINLFSVPANWIEAYIYFIYKIKSKLSPAFSAC